MAGIPLPGIRQEMLALYEMIKGLVGMKTDLGYVGYKRIPQRFEFRGQVATSRIDLLSPDERQRLIEFGRSIQAMIQASRAGNA